MKLLLGTLLFTLIGCGTTRYVVGSGENTPQGAACTDQCDVDMTCLPNGNCLITCTNAGGESCEIELSCSGGQCEVVRSECSGSSCCASQSKPAKE